MILLSLKIEDMSDLDLFNARVIIAKYGIESVINRDYIEKFYGEEISQQQKSEDEDEFSLSEFIQKHRNIDKEDYEMNFSISGEELAQMLLMKNATIKIEREYDKDDDGGYCDYVLVILKKPKDIVNDKAASILVSRIRNVFNKKAIKDA